MKLSDIGMIALALAACAYGSHALSEQSRQDVKRVNQFFQMHFHGSPGRADTYKPGRKERPDRGLNARALLVQELDVEELKHAMGLLRFDTFA